MGVLKVKVNGVWEEASPPVAQPVPEEVWTGTASPDPALPYELWVDTNTDPPLLKAKNDIGQWKEIGASASEVEVATADPTSTNPGAEIWYDPTAIETAHTSEVEIGGLDPGTFNPVAELWYTPNLNPPLTPPLPWDVNGTYVTGDWCTHPTVTEFWRALRATANEEPGVVLDAWTVSAAPPTVPIPGVPRANVNGLWEDVVVGDLAGEVWVNPDEPSEASVELWFDTDEADPPPQGTDLFMMRESVHAHHLYGPYTGSGSTPWTWVLKAGLYLASFQCSGVATVTGIRYVNCDMSPSGANTWVTIGQSKHWFNAVNIHYQMNQGVVVIEIPADGSYDFRLSPSASLSGDSNDFGHLTLIPCALGAVH